MTAATAKTTTADESAMHAVADAMRDAAKTASEHAARVKQSASEAGPKALEAISHAVYTGSYVLAYGVVYAAVFIAQSLPQENTVMNGFRDGGQAAMEELGTVWTIGWPLPQQLPTEPPWWYRLAGATRERKIHPAANLRAAPIWIYGLRPRHDRPNGTADVVSSEGVAADEIEVHSDGEPRAAGPQRIGWLRRRSHDRRSPPPACGAEPVAARRF
jgi:hypothetical protein